MAWTTPRTWVTNETVTAAIMNAHVRDNLKETSTATAQASGDLIYADASKSMGDRLPIGPAGSTLHSDGSDPVWRQAATDSLPNESGQCLSTSYGPLRANTSNENKPYDFSREVEVTLDTDTAALVAIVATLGHANAGSTSYLSFSISGATTSASTPYRSVEYEPNSADEQARVGATTLVTLTAGENTFTLECASSTSVTAAYIADPIISVVAL